MKKTYFSDLGIITGRVRYEKYFKWYLAVNH